MKINVRFRLLVALGAILLILLGAGGAAAALPATSLPGMPGQQASVPLPPAIPYSPWGTVTVNGSPAAENTGVKAFIASTQFGRGTVAFDGEQAWYTLDVPGDDPTTLTKEGGVAGDKVSFVVGDYPTCFTRPWAGESAEQVDLVAITQPDFADVPLNDPGFCAIRQIFQGGLTTGCNDGATPLLYCPDKLVTRCEMAAFIVRGTKLTQHSADALPSNWGFGRIEQLDGRKLEAGCEGGAAPLRAKKVVTRRETATILARAMDLTPCKDCTQHFADVPPSDPDFGWIERLYERQIITGCNDGEVPLLYCPDDPVTRREMAVFLARAFYPQ